MRNINIRAPLSKAKRMGFMTAGNPGRIRRPTNILHTQGGKRYGHGKTRLKKR